MPIDASIPLNVQPPKIEDPTLALEKVYTLRHLVQQGQIQQAQLKAAQQQNDARARTAAAQDSLSKLLSTHTTLGENGAITTDHGAVMKGLAAAGFGPEAMKYDTQRRADLKSAIDLQEQQVKLNGEKAKRLGSIAGSVLQATAAQRPVAYRTALHQAVQEGLISGDAAQQLAQQPYSPEVEAQLQGFVSSAMTADQQHTAHLADLREIREKALADTTIPKNKAQTVEAEQATAIRARQDAAGRLAAATSAEQYAQVLNGLPHGLATQFPAASEWDAKKTPTAVRQLGMTAEQQTTAAATTARDTRTAAHQTFTEGQERTRTGLAVAKNARDQAIYNQTYGQGIGPDGKPLPNPTATAIANYQVPPPSPRSLATPAGQALMRQILAVNPGFDATEFPNRARTRVAFTTGIQGQQANAMNTAIGHLDQLGVAVDALGNGDFTPANAGYNYLRTVFGSDKVTNFESLKTVLSGELANVFKKSGATDIEIANIERTIQSKNSPAQLGGYIRTQIPVLGSKLSALNYQYHQAMGATDPFQVLSPDAKGVLAKYGFDPNNPKILPSGAPAPARSTVTVMDPTGRTHVFPDQASADRFKKLAGIK